MKLFLFAAFLLASADITGQMNTMGQSNSEDVRLASEQDHSIAPPVIVEGLGNSGYDVEHATSLARSEFDNGVRLNNGFNEEEAIRAFQSAQQLDPSCALCFWGEAAALAPTINYTISSKEAAKAVAALDHAQALASDLSIKGRGIIAAERKRYILRNGEWTVDDQGAAKSADALANRFPQDDALQIADANAHMIAAEHGRPGSATANDPNLQIAQKRLDVVLKRNPDYTPALHFYLHLMEWEEHPERAETDAERLGNLAPNSGHLLHMASHIYYHTGRYEDAALANMQAATADIEYVAKVRPSGGMASLPMHQHNLAFGLDSALLSGNATIALRLAHEMQASYPPSSLVSARAYLAYGRFLPADDMLRMPEPKPALAAALYHFARGEAFTRQGDSASVIREADTLAYVQNHGDFGDEDHRVIAMIEVARLTLIGRAAMLRHTWPIAIDAYRKAALFAEANEPYADPPMWPWPPRRSLAEALVESNHSSEARQNAITTLKLRPGDGVTLHVLARAMLQLHDPDSSSIKKQAEKAWRGSADLLEPAAI